MKRVGLAIIMTVLVFSSLAAADGGVTWLTLNEGREKARVAKKPMMVDFYFGIGCPRCEELELKGYEDPAIAKVIMDDFVPIRVDLSKELSKDERELGEKYNYQKECLLLFLDPEGNIIMDPGGKQVRCATMIDADALKRYLDTVKASLTGKDKH